MSQTIKLLARLIGAVVLSNLFMLSAWAEEYKLGVGDTIRLRVVIFNDDARRFEIWNAVSGDYRIQPDGRISVPLAGSLDAANTTTEALGSAISQALKTRAGLLQEPPAAVEVVEYRPLYVLGDVARPGTFPASPGITALQAMAQAGGQTRTTAQNPGSLIRETGALSETLAEIVRNRAKTYRLRAEIDGMNEIEFPANLSHPGGAARLEGIFAEERALFASRKQAFELELETLEGLKDLLETEIAGLEQKLGGQLQQTELARQNLENVTSLVERGLSRATLLADAQRRLFQVESAELDLQNSIYRAQQRIREADRDVVSLKARRSTDATAELQRTNARLESLNQRRDTLRLVLLENGEVDVTEAEPLFRLVFT
ncbi:MAG: polysaccharide biosynthesis/export family protein, partial [Pseudomonadota bacterium]